MSTNGGFRPPNTRKGGSVNGDVSPVARNPFDYIWDGITPRQYKGIGHDDLYLGGDVAFINSQIESFGYPLVNKLTEGLVTGQGIGHDDLYIGGSLAALGVGGVEYSIKQYVIPSDPTKYPYFLYIGGETFPELATVAAARQAEFEDLCLKICPTEQWLGILVTYT